jgi:hypothetical protein
MKINVKQAVKFFFQNPSLDMVFKEAIANSLDANASHIEISVFIESFEKQESLRIEVADDGEGFTDARYEKFCELMKVDEETHKGIGRLVYLSYFKKIDVCSFYKNKCRKFSFSESFDKDHSDMTIYEQTENAQKTILVFSECSMKRLSSYQTITPSYLEKEIIKEFFPRLYLLKQEDKEFEISFSINVSNLNPKHNIDVHSACINNKSLPKMSTVSVNTDSIKMFESTNLDYAIVKKDPSKESFLMTALCVDSRTKILDDIISSENLPLFGYDFYFLLSSSIFDGKVDASRQNLTLTESILRDVKFLFRQKIAEILDLEMPLIKERKETLKKQFDKTYPHLMGYFKDDDIGIVSKAKSIDDAQKAFLRDQKEVLDASELDEKEYDKTLNVSARTLAQYILYRDKIISKVEQLTKKDSEAVLHNLILPKRSILQNASIESIYNNNLWLLDNKYMTYTTAMSERTMDEIMGEITQAAVQQEDDGRPDIAVVFSNAPDCAEEKSVDVVIVELKKRGIKLAQTEEVESQLQQRAVQLMKLYPNKIQRMWFYGVVEFTDQFKLSLRNNHYTPLFSKDSLYYKENIWYPDLDDSSKPYKVGTYILSIDAFIKDAKAHNEIFLNVLKSGFKKDGEEE